MGTSKYNQSSLKIKLMTTEINVNIFTRMFQKFRFTLWPPHNLQVAWLWCGSNGFSKVFLSSHEMLQNWYSSFNKNVNKNICLALLFFRMEDSQRKTEKRLVNCAMSSINLTHFEIFCNFNSRNLLGKLIIFQTMNSIEF